MTAGLTGPGHSAAFAGTSEAAPTGAEIDAELRAVFDEVDEATFMVLLEQQADLSAAAGADEWASLGEQVHDELTNTAEQSQASLQALLTERGADFRSFWIVNALQVTGDVALAEELAARPEVDQVLPEQEFDLPEPTPDEAPPSINNVEWGIDRINAPDVWGSYDVRGEGVVVGVIDTGVLYDHPALVEQYRGNLGGGEFDHAYSWHDPSNVCANPSLVPCDHHGHGTHVTGTIVGDDGGSNQIGVAPDAQWIAAMGCESNTCSDSALLSSGEFMLAPTDLNGENPRPELRPHIVNNSWGGGANTDPWYRGIVESWVAAGIFPQFANGNDPFNAAPCGSSSNPGNLPESYAAGAFDINGNIAGFSHRGPSAWDSDEVKPNIAAPGVQVRSAWANGSYQTIGGTSMASPHVAGAVALLWSFSPELAGDIDATREVLDVSAVDTEDLSCGGTPENNNVWGQGQLDVLAAVEASPVPGETGTLDGTVTDADSGDPLAATVVAEGEVTRTVTSGADGGYQVTLPAGEYEVTASASGYFAETVTEVVVVEDETSTVDFALEADPDAFQPSITVDPSELSSGQGPDTVVTQELTIGNVGDAELSWEILDEPAGSPGATSVTSVEPGEVSGEASLSTAPSLLRGVFGSSPRVATPEVPVVQDAVTLSHSESMSIVAENSVGCTPDQGLSTTENSYLRHFVLDDFGITDEFDVSEVSFGVEVVRGVSPTVSVNLYEMVDPAGSFEYGNFELIGSAEETLEPMELEVVTVPVSGTAAAGSTLVVEVDVPDLSGSGALFIGSNSDGQTAPSYLASGSCGLPEPTDTSAIGFPGMHVVMSVTGGGDVSEPSCEVPGWLSVSPAAGAVAPGGSQVVEVSFDSAGLADGDVVAGTLCVASDDPESPVVEIPVELVVEEVTAPVVEVSPGSLSAEVPVDGVVEQELSVGNTGDATLDWEIGQAEISNRQALLEEGVLLVPDSSGNRVMAFDPETGDLIDADFIPEDAAADLGTPIHMIPNPTNDGLLLSDQIRHVVNAYDLAGDWQGVAAPIGGADTSILQNMRGIEVSAEGTLLVTVAAGGNAHSVAEFDAEGNFLGTFIDHGAGGLDGPWDVLFRADDVLVSASGSGDIHRYHLDGTPHDQPIFFDGLGFPQQLQELPNGNVLVGQFTTLGGVTPGVWELTADGELVDVYTGVSGNRGVYELPNGNILTTNAGGVHEIDRGSSLVETKIEGANARFITHVQLQGCAAPGDVPWLSVSPASGSTEPGGSSSVAVSFDAAGVEPGDYEALLCVASNDPASPVVEVPVSMSVVEDDDPPGEPVVCDETITGVHAGALTITEGVTCLAAGAQVLGEVNVSAGAGLVATAAVVQGPVSAVGAAVVDLSFTQVTGPVVVSGATGSVSLFASQVTGSVSVVNGATASAAVVAGNTIIGSLSCLGNDPAPTDLGLANTATGGKLGQCAEL
ncbi:S8 family serine peptidase [Natronosporangium hydrolyticum]|uniref:S8 family serine peptidase n=1 Tax=Natronosporangium hydrolyticum TaxID=2811111 RepID=A0A895YP01_9ACTN|nr:S8 family serine peptidase [Natronosporangium hydrolyticum]QSB15678.1 S8 family serine peptidase [Natronosporangium hydrolyticum]